ncbi:MAG TPA: galactokinase family protein, partial [Ilumatobacteraceae bacterium]|nr:galactokinase family protein [Ilumatobacteraceae bacterium]
MVEVHRVHAPGRVNLIGDHTDYTGGLVFPMAIDRGTTIDYTPGTTHIRLTSADEPGAVEIALPVDVDPAEILPQWGSYVAAMARELGSSRGLTGEIASDIPSGAGLSSSAALECAI